MDHPQNRQDPRRAEKPAASPGYKAPGYKAPPAEKKKPVPDGYVDPTAGMTFPQPRRRRR